MILLEIQMLLALCLLWSILGFIAEVSGELTTQQRIAHLMVIVMFAIFVVLMGVLDDQ